LDTKTVKEKSADKQVPAATRTIAILRLLAKSNEPLSLREISSKLGLIPSTCLHILRVLVDESMVMLDRSTKRYQIGLGVLSLVRGVTNRDTTINFFRKEIELLANRLGVSTVATRIEHGRAITVATSFPPGVFSINTEVGSRYPSYVGATGRCLAAFGHDAREILKQIPRGSWYSIPDKTTWLQEVSDCARLGYSVDHGNLNAGVTVVAAPVIAPGGDITHTLGAIAISETAEKIGIDTMGRALVEVARRTYETA
jgi:DNA-binding IclR family transcriptional regulator